MRRSTPIHVTSNLAAAVFVLALGLALTPLTQRISGSTLPGFGSYVLDENFDAIDPSRWQKKWWWNGDTYYHTTDELQAYRDYNATASNGALAMTARREGVVDFQGRPHSYMSGMLQSDGIRNGVAPGFAFTYGKIEARIKMPAGQGFWTGFWLCNAAYDSNCNHEIDIMEFLGKTPNTAYFNYHWNGQNLESASRTASAPLSDGFHTYGLDWRPGKLVWYLDGVEVARYEGPGVTSEAHYIIFNFAVGGTWPGSPDATTPFPSSMLVDWVRVTA